MAQHQGTPNEARDRIVACKRAIVDSLKEEARLREGLQALSGDQVAGLESELKLQIRHTRELRAELAELGKAGPEWN